MRIILITLFSLCTSCASNPDVAAHRLALWNFTYEADKENEYRVYNSISSLFAGDCEDFAFTLQRQIGGDVWYIKLPNATAHAALLKDGFVYDNRYKHRVKLSEYRGDFSFILESTGIYTKLNQNM